MSKNPLPAFAALAVVGSIAYATSTPPQMPDPTYRPFLTSFGEDNFIVDEDQNGIPDAISPRNPINPITHPTEVNPEMIPYLVDHGYEIDSDERFPTTRMTPKRISALTDSMRVHRERDYNVAKARYDAYQAKQEAKQTKRDQRRGR
jgi:hypothetical protein